MRRRSHISCRERNSDQRAGLAPLELVLNLPIMLFVMALMMIIGTAGGWKARTHSVARQATSRSTWPRTGDNDAAPVNWPRNASMGFGDHEPAMFNNDPWSDHEVLRGPMLVEPETGTMLQVNGNLVNMTDGLQEGRSHIRRDFPIFKNLPPHEFEFTRENVILSGSPWQFRSQGISSNLTRRILHTYNGSLEEQMADLAERFFTAAVAAIENYDREEMTPLIGGDPEIRELNGNRSPDFRPQINIGSERATIPAIQGQRLRPGYCNDDLLEIQRDHVNRLMDRIEDVPRRMSDYYIGQYQRKINELEEEDPMPPGAAQLISELEGYIEQLNRFKATLPP